MNVTLVYPSIRYGGWNCLGKITESIWVNHGVAQIASCLEAKGHNVCLLDLREMQSWNHFKRAVEMDQRSSVYGVSMATLDFHVAVQCGRIIRECKPDSLIVAGGPHPSICSSQVSQEACFDHVVKGEGEVTFPKLIENPSDYPRVVVGERPDLDSLPLENREVFNLKRIFATKQRFFRMPFVNVISGRGCVFRCGFCKPGEDLIFGRFRMRSLDNFMSEICFLRDRYRFETLMIDDDSFTLNKSYLQEFAERYRREVGKPFVCQTRADFVCNNPDLMRELRDSGLDTVFIGLESGSQRMLDFMDKDCTVEQNFEAAEICKKLGVEVWANFMIGLPTETKEEMQATLDMIRKIKPKHPSGAFFTPIVGTKLYSYCVQNNLLLSDDPEVLGSRNPSIPKIKGIDYPWMLKQLHKNVPLWKRALHKAVRTVKRLH